MSTTAKNTIGVLARLIIGGALLVAGLLKVGKLDANVLSVNAYRLPISDGLVHFIGYAQPFVEILLGLLVVAGILTRWSSAAATVLMVVFMIGIASLWARGLNVDCGCFSKGGETANPHYLRELLRDTVFLAAGVWLVWRPITPWSVDNWLAAPTADEVNDVTGTPQRG